MYQYILKIALFLLLLLSGDHLLAQKKGVDRVYLRSGDRLSGTVLHYGDTLHLRLLSGQDMYLLRSNVKKVYMGSQKSQQPYEFKEKGWFNTVAVAANFGRVPYVYGGGSSPTLGYNLQTTFGYQFDRRLGVGIGMAYSDYYLLDATSPVAAIYAEARTYLSRRTRAEYFALSAGYGHPMLKSSDGFDSAKGGLWLQPTFGWRLGASARYNFFFDMGLNFQNIHLVDNNEWAKNNYSVWYRRTILRGGIVF